MSSLFPSRIENRVAIKIAANHGWSRPSEPLGMSHDSLVSLADVVFLSYLAHRARPNAQEPEVARAAHPNGRDPSLSRLGLCLKGPGLCCQDAKSLMLVFSPPTSL